MKRLLTLLAVLALFVGACGDTGDDTTTAVPGTSTTSATAPPTTAPTTTAPVTTSPPTTLTPTTIGPTTPPTIAPPPLGADYVNVYYTVDGFIAPVARQLEVGDNPELVAINQLLAGPTADEMAAVPAFYGGEAAELLGISIVNDIATVDLSAEFNSPTGTSGETMRLAALTFTLTDLPTVNEVVLMIDGQRLQYFGGHGWDITPSLNRDTFMVNQGAFGSVLTCQPAWWRPVSSPMTITGYAEGFAGTVQFAIYDREGLELATGETAVTPIPVAFSDHGAFHVEVPFTVDTAQLGSVMVWDDSEGANSQANLVEHAVWLMP